MQLCKPLEALVTTRDTSSTFPTPTPTDPGLTRTLQTGLWVLSRQASQQVDLIAVQRLGIPSIVLMENASLALCERVLAIRAELARGDRAGSEPTPGQEGENAALHGEGVSAGGAKVVVLAGPGNNGGDGFALARQLHIRGVEVTIMAVTNPAKHRGDAATNLAIVQAMGLEVCWTGDETPDRVEALCAAGPVVIVDAMLGTGLTSAARPPIGGDGGILERINRLHSPRIRVLAVDVPSGLDCDLGLPAGSGRGKNTNGVTQAAGIAIEADETVTFVAPKQGLMPLESQQWTGRLWVAGIGLGDSLVHELGFWLPRTRPGEESATESIQNDPDQTPPQTHGRGKA